MKLPISNRLLACAGFVQPGHRVADIGCDHGYLSIHLLTKGIASRVIASDIKEQPLQSAIRNAEKYGVREQMEFYLSDGVRAIPRDFDTLICAGMGGDTMISILKAAPWLQDRNYRLILQCQSKTPLLRQYLYDNGYGILRETLAKDGKFVYSIMEVTFDPGKAHAPIDAYLSPQLLKEQHALLQEYYARVKNGVELTVSGLQHTNDPRLAQYEMLLSQFNALEEQIYDNRD